MAQVVTTPDGRRLSLESLGDPNGKPVFLLHGTPGGRHGPRPRGIILHRLGIRLISYDRPGYAGSDRLPERTVADAGIDVEAIADYFGIDRFSIVGRSGGGPHALACAALLKQRVICAAALCSLAPCDAQDLDWSAGMTDSNVRAYNNAWVNPGALIATLCEKAGKVRANSEGVLKGLQQELADHDKDVIGDIALRRLIARTHAEALRETADGWIDDVIALSRPWGFSLSDIVAPVKLWSGSGDVFSPTSHTRWLAGQISKAELEIASGAAHFGAMEILPKILTWVLGKVNAEALAERLPVAPGC
ncbi:MAG TPA: alpha/beta hydrolase [Trebonia sp.]|nr:alpha/beta hydrolase [Trebonia sp.]